MHAPTLTSTSASTSPWSGTLALAIAGLVLPILAPVAWLRLCTPRRIEKQGGPPMATADRAAWWLALLGVVVLVAGAIVACVVVWSQHGVVAR